MPEGLVDAFMQRWRCCIEWAGLGHEEMLIRVGEMIRNLGGAQLECLGDRFDRPRQAVMGNSTRC